MGSLPRCERLKASDEVAASNGYLVQFLRGAVGGIFGSA